MNHGLQICATFMGILLSAGSCAASGERRPTPSLDRVILEMEAVREGIQDLVTVVERTTVASGVASPNVADISLTYKKPDKLLTEVKGGSGRTVVINGEKMWVYSPDLAVVEMYRLEDGKNQAQAIYEASWGLTSPIKVLIRGMNRKLSVLEDGTYLINLVPDQKDAAIEKIEAWVDPRTWLISKMEIYRPGQPAVRLRVKEWKSNQGVKDAVFDFQIPPGTDVFEPLEKGSGGF